MGKIATKGWINSNRKTVSGWSGNNNCPTKSEIESANSSLEVSGSYASNQLVQQDDINVYRWKYYFTGTPTSISDWGAGGTYTINVNSKRVWTVNGVETGIEEYIGWTFSGNPSWVSGVQESPLSRLRVTVSGGYQSAKSGSISFRQADTTNTFSVSVSLASRYILRYTGLTSNQGVGIFNSDSTPRSDIGYSYYNPSSGSGTLVTYDDSGFSIQNVATGGYVPAYLGDAVYVRAKLGNSWGRAVQVTLTTDTTVQF